jgi:hypothetical protein
LLERWAEAPVLGMKSHDRRVNRLAQRIECQQPDSRGEGGFVGSGTELVGEHFLAGPKRQDSELLAFTREPLLERHLVDVEPIEQVAAVDANRFGQGTGTSISDEPPEAHGVRGHQVEVEHDSVIFDAQTKDSRGSEGHPQRREGDAKIVARFRFTGLGPEKSRQRLTRAGAAGGKRQTRQDSSGLLQGER